MLKKFRHTQHELFLLGCILLPFCIFKVFFDKNVRLTIWCKKSHIKSNFPSHKGRPYLNLSWRLWPEHKWVAYKHQPKAENTTRCLQTFTAAAWNKRHLIVDAESWRCQLHFFFVKRTTLFFFITLLHCFATLNSRIVDIRLSKKPNWKRKNMFDRI